MALIMSSRARPLATGYNWSAAGPLHWGARLVDACYNIPLVNVLPGASTGCYLRPISTPINVRSAPRGQQVTQISSAHKFAALGQNLNGDWLFFRLGWVSRSTLELSGACDALPVLDPAAVSSGVVHFCPPEYAGYLRPRIGVGAFNARVASHTFANRLRAGPQISTDLLGEIAPRSLLDAVLDGPACDGAFVWWQVQVNGQIGWTVESDRNANYYYLEPAADSTQPSPAPLPADQLAPADHPLPAADQMISSANLHLIDTIAILPTPNPQQLAWSPAQSYLAVVGTAGTASIFQYPALTLIPGSADLLGELRVTAIAFSPDETWLALGAQDGRVILAQIRDGALHSALTLPQRLEGPLRALAWSNDGNWLAAAGGARDQIRAGANNALPLWQFDRDAGDAQPILQRHYAFPYPLTDLAFSRDDRWLAVTGESARRNRAAIWIYDSVDFELAHSKSLIYMQGAGLVEASPAAEMGDFIYSSGDSLYALDLDSGSDRRFYHRAGALLPQLAIRWQIVPDAEILAALGSTSVTGSIQPQLFNALNADSPHLKLTLSPSAMAFSPDGRLLAIADPARDRVLLLGVTTP